MAQSTFLDFAREQLPEPPARVLEVGCGQGELTTALAVAGYEVLGIDPVAPQGDLFRRILIEDLEPQDGPFDAVVASHALHHVRDLDAGIEKIVSVLPPGGPLVVDDFGWDRLDDTTLDWFYGQQRALAAAGHGEGHASRDELRASWEAHHVGVHPFEELRRAFAAQLEERVFQFGPHLYRKLGGVSTKVLEEALIDAGAIQPLGFRWVGVAPPRGG